ncbi:hypothetical protein SAMN06265171_101707 [Chryseobacterium rhizoplanae]|uniref:Uncharacterized protein n=1 Tax=Chryseobacterium rhizoplanae TaxID=1609531 RepID=A0A521B5N9_9FLAO|nr:hypothetical protein SAMN06265171_101707 [Chryseobacterium rhizoplanae]
MSFTAKQMLLLSNDTFFKLCIQFYVPKQKREYGKITNKYNDNRRNNRAP